MPTAGANTPYAQEVTRTRNLKVALAAGLALLTTACGSSMNAKNTAAKSPAPLIGVDFPRSDTDFWHSYIKYVPQSAKELGVTLKTANSNNDIANLISNIQTFMSQDVQGVVMAPQDTAAIAPSLDELATKKIPVVTIDTRPDSGQVFMVVRTDNRSYGMKACQFLGTKLGGKGKVVVLEGSLDSINGRDRTEGFDDCMKANYPGITVFGEAAEWKPEAGASMLEARLAANPDIKGIYMESSFALTGTLQILQKHGLQVPPTDPKHVFVVSNDGIPAELADIKQGLIDATVNQPADQFAKYGLYYAKAATTGQVFKPGPTDHGSTIVQVRDGLLEDQLPAPLVTLDGADIGGHATTRYDDKSLWANNMGG
jgi:ABC-type sugar transport system substrate-binding protein